jgi:hypothetical protein
MMSGMPGVEGKAAPASRHFGGHYGRIDTNVRRDNDELFLSLDVDSAHQPNNFHAGRIDMMHRSRKRCVVATLQADVVLPTRFITPLVSNGSACLVYRVRY